MWRTRSRATLVNGPSTASGSSCRSSRTRHRVRGTSPGARSLRSVVPSGDLLTGAPATRCTNGADHRAGLRHHRRGPVPSGGRGLGPAGDVERTAGQRDLRLPLARRSRTSRSSAASCCARSGRLRSSRCGPEAATAGCSSGDQLGMPARRSPSWRVRNTHRGRRWPHGSRSTGCPRSRRASRPNPLPIHQARKAPPNASPAPTVSTTLAGGTSAWISWPQKRETARQPRRP